MSQYSVLCSRAIEERNADMLITTVNCAMKVMHPNDIAGVFDYIFGLCDDVGLLERMVLTYLEWREFSENSVFWLLYRLCAQTNYHGDIVPLVKTLLTVVSREYVWSLNEFNATLMFYLACTNKSPKLVSLLVEHGANIHYVRPSGSTPLRGAIDQSNWAVADWLIGHGAQIANGVTPNHPFIRQRRHCLAAKRALIIVLLKKTVVQKDVLRYLIGPAVWETRLDPAWQKVDATKRVKN